MTISSMKTLTSIDMRRSQRNARWDRRQGAGSCSGVGGCGNHGDSLGVACSRGIQALPGRTHSHQAAT